jgi:hypothetical protein
MALAMPGSLDPLCRLAFVDEPVSKFVVQSEIGGSQFHFSNMKSLHTFFVARLELQIRKDLVEVE